MVDVRPPKRPAAQTQAFSTANQISQRQAVAAIKQRMRVRIALQTFGGDKLRNIRVLVDGELYDVDQSVLAKLRSGLLPADLELEPADCGDEC